MKDAIGSPFSFYDSIAERRKDQVYEIISDLVNIQIITLEV